MKLLILGGGPLGEQAVRLGRAAGMELTVLEGAGERPSLTDYDYILPATEDETLLALAEGEGALFDRKAWELTRSRLASDEFMRTNGIPIPAYFPEGSEPYIVKPDKGSFGRGIWVTEDFCEVGGAVNAGFVAQEELDGPVWSAVVIGVPGRYTAFAPVRLTFSDRCRTGAQCQPAEDSRALMDTARAAAEAMGLRGVLEVEAVRSHGVWTVTDLNARLPMLTPDALLESEGVNLLMELIAALKA
ncbi:MAG: ATP-grasp domain-containing protein [Oscillospiraceae bacterium]|nr:ATP-grasp domain-containing protein [Oscillospiraceae bacterium]